MILTSKTFLTFSNALDTVDFSSTSNDLRLIFITLLSGGILTAFDFFFIFILDKMSYNALKNEENTNMSTKMKQYK